MISLTSLSRPYFRTIVAHRNQWCDRHGIKETQMKELRRLLSEASATEYGKKYGFEAIKSYEDYRASVPRVEYEDIRAYVERMVSGEADILWPGVCRRFAQSSGTSGGKSKYIPITDISLKRNHYPGAAEGVASYLTWNPASKLFSGKSFILGGSFANEIATLPAGVRVGDLSATLINCINPIVNLFRVPDKKTALMSNWHEKLPALIEKTKDENVTNISGVPSWFMNVIQGILDAKGVDNIHEVWPNLEVFFHGGISFEPYRKRYEAITNAGKMHFLENYNASEGFFASQDQEDAELGMLLLLKHGVFYEFAPLDGSAPVAAWEVEKDRTYELLISNCNGLFRYSPGDTVHIESVAPLRIKIAGRTSSYINAFGEELMVWNAETALAHTLLQHGGQVANYSAAPVYADGGHKGRHEWIIEWTERPNCDNAQFAATLDKELQNVNSDYQAKRSGDIFLDRLTIVDAPTGSFDQWLENTGKLGGQRKVPRLCNDRHIADALLKQITNHK